VARREKPKVGIANVRKNFPTNAGRWEEVGVTEKRIGVSRATFRQVIHNIFEHKFWHFFVASAGPALVPRARVYPM
jgi:hypothetical protein